MAIDPKMAAKLKNFNKNFAKEKKRADELGGFSEIPDGKYLAKVASCDLKNSNAGEMHLVFQFEIVESAEDESLIGAKASKWCNIEKEDGQAYLIRDLRRFGIELENLEQLPEIAKMIDDQKPELKISLKTGSSGQFTYIDQVISEMDAGEHAAPEDVEGEDPEPEDDAEPEPEPVDLEVGMTVSYTNKAGKEVSGEITKILEKKGTVHVKVDGKVFEIAVDRLSMPDDAEPEVEPEPEPEPEPEKPTAKKPVAAAKKTVAKKPLAKKRR